MHKEVTSRSPAVPAPLRRLESKDREGATKEVAAIPRSSVDPSPKWPSIGLLGLTAEAKSKRSNSIGGSDANVILSGSPERVLRNAAKKSQRTCRATSR